MLVVHHPDQALHDPERVFRLGTWIDQPDRAERYRIFLGVAEEGGHRIELADSCGLEPILKVHDPEYVAFLQTAHARWRELPNAGPDAIPHVHPTHRMHRKPTSLLGELGWYSNSTSCPIQRDTWTAIYASARTAVHAADRVAATGAPAYALCRPPGHHAYPDLMTGVCYLNNAAIAAERLLARFGRVAVLDIDVHHCNGTQHIFWTRADVFVASVHCDPDLTAPFYAGHVDEIGDGAGRGANLNVPLPMGTRDAAFLGGVDQALAAIRAYAPGALVVSLGFDASEHDPTQTFKVSVAGFAQAARRIRALGVPTLLVQEGGYLNPHLGDNLRMFLAMFAERS
ncbi:MAG TPA: histone deacetylase family protein [Acetobacteraceae bacterium]|nr:histone deacetylase family protein [Acetobacteraceae bacterium]